METTRKYPINEKYQAVVKVISPAIWIYIEEKYKVWFIPRTKRIGRIEGFELGEEPNGIPANQYSVKDVPFSLLHVVLLYRHIRTFYLQAELANRDAAVMAGRNEKQR